ncbi:MAG TPA: Fic family protein [Conexibacter sp.]|nr:Fic family protein [Conexibacter sp.]
MEQLELEDLLLIGEAVLGMAAEALVGATRLSLARSALDAPFAADGRGRDRYPGLAAKAAVLCSRLVRNHPLPDGNKRVALLAMLELIARNGGRWTPPPGGQDEIATTLERLAARELSETAFGAWVRERVG